MMEKNDENDTPIDENSRFVHRKGLFWIIPDKTGCDDCIIVYAANCDSNGIADENAPPYNSKNGKSYAHKNTWPLVCGKYKNKPWNYYPRGRVEITKGEATVYYNPILQSMPMFDRAIIGVFKLMDTQFRGIPDLPVRFIPDYSKHYESIWIGDFKLCFTIREIQPVTGPFYYYKGNIHAPVKYLKAVNPVTYHREQLTADAGAGEHRDMWDNYMLIRFPELKETYDDNHKALPRGRVDCKIVGNKLTFWVTLDKCIMDKETDIIRRFRLESYNVEFHYGTMNYKCIHCREE